MHRNSQSKLMRRKWLMRRYHMDFMTTSVDPSQAIGHTGCGASFSDKQLLGSQLPLQVFEPEQNNWAWNRSDGWLFVHRRNGSIILVSKMAM